MYDTDRKAYSAREHLGDLQYKFTSAQLKPIYDLLPSQSKTVARILEHCWPRTETYYRTNITVWGCSDSGHFQMADVFSGLPGVELYFGPAEPENRGAINIHFRSGIPQWVRGRGLDYSLEDVFHSGFTAPELVSLLPESFTRGLSDKVRGKVETVAQLLESCSLGSIKYLKDILLSLEGMGQYAGPLVDLAKDQNESASLNLVLSHSDLSDIQIDDEIVRRLVPLFWRECQYAENPAPLECYLNIVSFTPLSVKLSRTSESIRNEFSEVLASERQKTRRSGTVNEADAQEYQTNEGELGLRRFAPGFRRPHPDQLREWFLGEMVTPDGTIVADEAYIILREFFQQREILWELREGAMSAIELSHKTFMDPFHVRSICRQLAALGHNILIEDPAFSTKFRLRAEKIPKERFDRLRAQFRPVW